MITSDNTVEITPTAWTCRFNKTGIDGETFTASFLVTHCLNNVVQVHMASSEDVKDFLRLRKVAKSYFRSLGYTKYEYNHNGKFVEEFL